MSKKLNNSVPMGTVGYSSGYVLFDCQIQNLEGRILTLIEGLGLKDTQEKAVKDLARDIIYSLYRDTRYVCSDAVMEAFKIQDKSGSGVDTGNNLISQK